MALKDVKKYFKQVESQYFEMRADLKDIDASFENGEVPSETIEQFKSTITKLKDNYDRLAYVMYLFSLPQRKSKRGKFIESDEVAVFNYLSNSTDTVVIQENDDVLKYLRDFLKSRKGE